MQQQLFGTAYHQLRYINTSASTTMVPRGLPGGMKMLSNDALAAASAASSAWLRLSYRARRALDLACRAFGFVLTHYTLKQEPEVVQGSRGRVENTTEGGRVWGGGVRYSHT